MTTGGKRLLRRSPLSRGLVWPLSILAISLLLYGSSFVVRNWYDWKPLTVPVDLKAGAVWSSEFQVDLQAHYLVVLEIDRQGEPAELDCLLGGFPWRSPCEIDSVVDIEWKLWNGQLAIAAGSSRNEGGGTLNWRTIGQFDATPGTTYVLAVTSLQDGSELAAANPRIVVRVHPAVSKGYFVNAEVMAFLAKAIAGVGVLCLMIWAAAAYRGQKKSQFLLLAAAIFLHGCIVLPIPHHRSLTPRVEGTVLDAETRRPVKGVVVRVETQGGGAARTNEAVTLDSGSYRVQVRQRAIWWGFWLGPAARPLCTGKASISAPGYADVSREFSVWGIAGGSGPCGGQRERWDVLLDRKGGQNVNGEK